LSRIPWNRSNTVALESMMSALCAMQALATGGYIAGNFPPGKMFHFSLAGQVLMNLLKAHCKAYTAIKALPNASGTKFGLTHAMWKFRPAGKGVLYLPAK
jgi:beta-glucosidase/6-phospho-beta-glucosidase/beta-galactosidase